MCAVVARRNALRELTVWPSTLLWDWSGGILTAVDPHRFTGLPLISKATADDDDSTPIDGMRAVASCAEHVPSALKCGSRR